jgi:predicted TIM-barrel fold metal-dependent hydrolase
MIIDSHTHIGFNEYLNKSAKDLVESIKKAGINKAMVYSGDIFNCSTEGLIKEIAPFRSVLFPVGSVSPLLKSRPSVELVEKWLKMGLIFGLKFYPAYEYFYPNGKEIRPYLKILEKYGKPAVFHSGDTFNLKNGGKIKYAHPLHIDDIAVDFPDLRIVISHIGYPWIIDAAEVVYKNKNVFADCSGLAYGKLEKNDKDLIKKLVSEFVKYAECLVLTGQFRIKAIMLNFFISFRLMQVRRSVFLEE